MKKYPFKFLDAYQKEDKAIFFGREEEIEALYRLVFQANIMLVYGPSGTGKTSLIRCGLANRFKTSQWKDLYIRRGTDINQSLLDTIITHTPAKASSMAIASDEEEDWFESVLESEEEAGGTEIQRLKLSTDNPVAHALQALYMATFTPIYLIFDQFEELYTLGRREEQQKLTDTLAELVSLPLPIKIIIVMREEYLARLYDLEKAVPQLRHKKLRIETMDLARVEQVILSATVENPQSNVLLEQGREVEVAQTIIEKVREGDISVKLPYLQVFMDRLYEKATGEEVKREAEALLTADMVQKMGNIGDVLADFIELQSTRLQRKLAQKYTDLPADFIWQLLSPFATIDGTKVPIRQSALHQIKQVLDLPDTKQSEELIKEAVADLENSRILRYRKEEQTYEVAHDSLALQIAEKRSEEEKTYLKARRMVTDGFAGYQDTRTLLSPEQLLFIRPYEQRILGETNPGQQHFIKQSKKAYRRRRAALLAGIIGAFMVAIAVILVVLNEQQKAIDEKLRADEKTVEAESAKRLAEQRAREAKAAEIKADEKRLEAKAATQLAEEQAKAAEAAEIIAKEETKKVQLANLATEAALNKTKMAEQNANLERERADGLKDIVANLVLLKNGFSEGEQGAQLPYLELFFDNDRPRPYGNQDVSAETYLESLQTYQLTIPRYLEEFSSSSVSHMTQRLELEAFFTNTIFNSQINFENLVNTAQEFLKLGVPIIIEAKGCAAPTFNVPGDMRQNNYNSHLINRRVDSIRRELSNSDLAEYENAGLYQFQQVPGDCEQQLSSVDFKDLSDQNNPKLSIFSIDALLSRRVELTVKIGSF